MSRYVCWCFPSLSGNRFFRSDMFPKESHLSFGIHLRFLTQMDPQKGKESSLKIDVSNMYIRFDFFSGFLSPTSRLYEVDGDQYLRSTFIFVMRCSRYTHVFLVGAPLYPLPYIHLIPSLCRALKRVYFAHGTKKEDESEKLRDKDRNTERRKYTGEMCNKRIADQRSRPGFVWGGFKDLSVWLSFIKADPKANISGESNLRF